MNKTFLPYGMRELTLEEQQNRIAGSYELDMNPLYLAKSACEVKAAQLLASGQVSNMSILGLAQEIFAHACAYYASSALIALGIDNAKVNEIKARANPVNIDDGGDPRPGMVELYAAIWIVTPSVISPV